MREPTMLAAARPALRRNPQLLLGPAVLAATLFAFVAAYSLRLGHFPTPFDYTSAIDAALPLVFVAIGQSLVVLSSGIDLSVGGVMSLCVGLAATHLDGGVGHVLAWVAVILLVGVAAGAANGVLIVRGRVAPILVTLATLSIDDGLALKVLPSPGGHPSPGLTRVLADPEVPVGLVWVAVAVAGLLLMRRTGFGMRLYAVGSDEGAARASGVPVGRVKIITYALSGLCGAVAGLFYTATTTSGDANAGTPYVLTSIAAVVIGGIAFRGGRGSALGAVAGAFALTLVVNVLFFLGINPLYQSFFQGLFLVVAVLLGSVVAVVSKARKGAA